MKFFYLFFLLIFISCVPNKHTYMCGDRVCLDKNEFKEYFAKNLIFEVKAKPIKKNKYVDLAKLNDTSQKKNSKNFFLDTNLKKEEKKAEKLRLKTERIILKEERKRKKYEEKAIAREEKKLTKLKKYKTEENIIKNDKPKTAIKENNINKANLEESIGKNKKFTEYSNKTIENVNVKIQEDLKEKQVFKSTKSKNQMSICKDVEKCDIEKIAELLIKKGKEKNFPNIASK
jgi:hypothetical protein